MKYVCTTALISSRLSIIGNNDTYFIFKEEKISEQRLSGMWYEHLNSCALDLT